jgi:hypothetical protein
VGAAQKTLTAVTEVVYDYPVARPEVGHLAPNFGNYAGNLVPDDKRKIRHITEPVEDLDVGTVDAASHHLNQRLAGPWRGRINFRQIERFPQFAQDCC